MSVDDQAMDAFLEDIEKFDQIFADWKAKNPDRSFSYFSSRRGVKHIQEGKIHSTLGPYLPEGQDWYEDGYDLFLKILEQAQIPETAKVCEVRCGTLRIGVHFIVRQSPGNYFGLDVVSGYYKVGIEMIGDLMKKKGPHFGIFEKRAQAAAEWGPDFVFSTSAAAHIPPEEEQEHFGMLRNLASKKGARVVFQAYLGEESFRFARSGWARTLEQYCELMHPFELVSTIDDDPWESQLHSVDVKILTFAAPSQA